MAEFPFAAPTALTAAHKVETFDCGKAPLNEFLHRYARTNDRAGSARTFVVVTTENVVIGYYSLAAAAVAYAAVAYDAVAYDAAPERVKQGQPRHPMPAILMARFAVDQTQQGQGLGRMLFRDALLRSLNITQELGARVFAVDAKDDEALRFYTKFNMMRDPVDPHRLYLLFKDIKKILAP